jgi:hypothetical protein
MASGWRSRKSPPARRWGSNDRAEIIALAKKRGATLTTFRGNLRVYSKSEPDESLVRLSRANKQEVIDALLVAETEPHRWRRALAEKVETIMQLRGLTRPDAEREAFQHVVVEYSNETHTNTDPTRRCRSDGEPVMHGFTALLGSVARTALCGRDRSARQTGRCREKLCCCFSAQSTSA